MSENEIDTLLFVEVICAEGAVLLHREESLKPDIFEWYLANGRRVQICVSDEFISRRTAIAYTEQLGFTNLGERLFKS